ncbi:MAG: SUMF1/EgtB/PvdO family nonheme iron enzyme [Deltaproteobacteria bacterium]|nr:SUMF1/EgtB/PvdO family nonheme iron enzyme [Deltaproteobacteria bacterium]
MHPHAFAAVSVLVASTGCWASHGSDTDQVTDAPDVLADESATDTIDEGCIPNCAGHECGPDPVCGTSCGVCRPGWECAESGACRDRCRESYCDQVLVPAGPFVMGSDDDNDIILPPWITHTQPLFEEMPEHIVILSTFWIDRYEVTTERYWACVGAGECRAPIYPEASDRAYLHHPISVAWDDAVVYCAWIGRRLPTEAEWEKAARGGCELGGDPSRCDDPEDERQWPWGWEIPDCSKANIVVGPGGESTSCAVGGRADTMPVGSYPAGRSPYGVEDMTGNVWEWVADWFGYYDDFGCATGCTNPVGPASGDNHVMRGCYFTCDQGDESNVIWSRVTGRIPVYYWPGLPPVDYTGDGFRCASDGE